MECNQLSVNVNESFSEQPEVRDFLNSPSEGPVSEVILYRLLSIADRAMRNELMRIGSKDNLIGLRLGYILFNKNTLENVSEVISKTNYSVGWGVRPEDKQAVETTEKIPDPLSNTDLNPNPLSFEFINNLSTQLTKAMREMSSPSTLDDNDLYAHFYMRTEETESTSCPWQNPNDLCFYKGKLDHNNVCQATLPLTLFEDCDSIEA